jgi:hypothetical protein
MTQKVTPEHWRRFLAGKLPRPQGEDFFLFQVHFDTPADPCWDDGFDIVGTWKNCCAIFNVNLLAQADHNRHVRLTVYQGEEARRQMLHDLAEERRYQQQRRTQPNN